MRKMLIIERNQCVIVICSNLSPANCLSKVEQRKQEAFLAVL